QGNPRPAEKDRFRRIVMSTMPQILLAWVNAIGWTLLHFVWQGAIVGLAYRALRPVCSTVTARYHLGMGFLVAAAACPLATLAWLAPSAQSAAGVAVALPALTVGGDVAVAGSGFDGVEVLLPWLVAAWLLGASIIAIRAFSHWRRLSWLVRNASVPLA